jgi:hypothetical protein
MPGSAVLDPDNLLDSLIPLKDELEGALNPLFGLRQFRVYLETVTWSGGRRGVGTGSLVSVEITPSPSVKAPNNQGAQHWEGTPAGRVEEGELQLEGVSLTYTEAQLTGGSPAAGVEFRYKITDAQGQGIAARYYVPIAPPFADREKTIGWKVGLRRVEPLVAAP